MADRIGQTFGNYRLLRLLGQGGFAQVYLGEHIHLGSRAAIKVLDTKLVTYEQEEFLREARIVASLEHPSIIRVLDCGVERDEAFLIMNYAPHGTLRQRHPSGSRLSIAQINVYVRQIAAALQYVHEHKLIHRDVKPENMLRGPRGELLLSDFGIALASSTSSSHSTKVAAGTVAYMAPEQIMGKARAASDQYALGVVVYEWLCGERPFRGSFTEMCTQHLYAPPPSLCQKQPLISFEIEDIIFKALAKEPEQRFASVREFANALAACSPRTTIPLLPDIMDEDEPVAIQPPVDMFAIQGGFTTVQAIEKEQVEVDKPAFVEPISLPEQTTLSRQTPMQVEVSRSQESESAAWQAIVPIEASEEKVAVPAVVSRDVPKWPGVLLRSGQPITKRSGLLTATFLLLLITMAPFLYMMLASRAPVASHVQQLVYNRATSKAVTPSLYPKARVQATSTPSSNGLPSSVPIISIPTSDSRQISNISTSNGQPSNVPTSNGQPITDVPPTSDSQQITNVPTSNILPTSSVQPAGTKVQATPSPTPTPVPRVTQPIQRQVTGQASASQIATATGQILMPATSADGILMIHMGCAPVNGKTFSAGMVIADSAQIVNADGSLTQLHAVLEVTVALGPNEDKTVPVHIQETGAIGNLASGNFVYQTQYTNTCGTKSPGLGVEDWHVWNDRAFTGGQDEQIQTTVQQSDIDTAASVLTPKVKQSAIAAINSQKQANEHMSVDPTCITNVTTNYAANDQVPNVTVTVTATCVGTLST